MRLGALLGPIGDAANARALAEQARRYAGEGFTSLWSAQAIGRGFMITDPFIALTVAATATQALGTATEAVEIGSAVVQVPLYHPVELAHRVFSLAQVCGDRLTLGVGTGSTEQDFVAFGRDYATRFKTFRDSVAQLRVLFATGQLNGVDLSPWPSVTGGPPLYLGSWGRGVERAAAEFDGWIASANYRTPDQVIAALARYRQGGGRRAIVSTIQVPPKADLGELAAKLDRFAAAGFDDAVVMILPGGPDPAAIRKLVR
jgi:alkanesulfonate monooxygenase SsuD/methylene tetrahydromethanopterin reductase-like flavin-dependent oxidoreductase (luciferase family)